MPIYSPIDEKIHFENDEDITPGSGEKTTAATAAADEIRRRDKSAGTAAASAGRKKHEFGDLFVEVSITLPTGERFRADQRKRISHGTFFFCNSSREKSVPLVHRGSQT